MISGDSLPTSLCLGNRARVSFLKCASSFPPGRARACNRGVKCRELARLSARTEPRGQQPGAAGLVITISRAAEQGRGSRFSAAGLSSFRGEAFAIGLASAQGRAALAAHGKTGRVPSYLPARRVRGDPAPRAWARPASDAAGRARRDRTPASRPLPWGRCCGVGVRGGPR